MKHKGKIIIGVVALGIVIAGAVVFYKAIQGTRLHRQKSTAMAPTIKPGDMVFVRLFSGVANPKRFEMIMCQLPNYPGSVAVFRVVGLPGETVLLKSNQCMTITGVTTNAFSLSQYVGTNTFSEMAYGQLIGVTAPVTLATNEVFVIGDNLARAGDSRVFGPLPLSMITGTVVAR